MTHEFNPGAKTLYYHKTKGIGYLTASMGEWVFFVPLGSDELISGVLIGYSILTPLIRAVVQSDGTVKELNKYGDDPPEWGDFACEDEARQADYHPACRKWEEAEAALRTWKSTCLLPCGPGDFHENGKCYKSGCMAPGTIVLGYVKDDLFVILQKAEDNA